MMNKTPDGACTLVEWRRMPLSIFIANQVHKGHIKATVTAYRCLLDASRAFKFWRVYVKWQFSGQKVLEIDNPEVVIWPT